MGRNVHTSCFAVKEPDADDEETGEREATMASVLALYRRLLVERTKHHLGTLPLGRSRSGSVDFAFLLLAPPRSGPWWPDLVTHQCAGRFSGLRVAAFFSVGFCLGIFGTLLGQNAVLISFVSHKYNSRR